MLRSKKSESEAVEQRVKVPQKRGPWPVQYPALRQKY